MCINDFFEDKKNFYILSEYLKNYVTLLEYYTPYAKMGNFCPEDTCIIICEKLKHGLDLIHKTGIIHGDINPSNVMVNVTPKEIKIKYIDFGLSHYSDKCSIGKFDGNQYDPPELFKKNKQNIKSEQYCIRADYWALGITLLMLLINENFSVYIVKNNPQYVIESDKKYPEYLKKYGPNNNELMGLFYLMKDVVPQNPKIFASYKNSFLNLRQPDAKNDTKLREYIEKTIIPLVEVNPKLRKLVFQN